MVIKSAAEKKALTRGETGVQESTIEMFSRAKKSIEELMRVAERVFDALKKKEEKLQQGGKDTVNGIKKQVWRGPTLTKSVFLDLPV